ncbi:MAG: hypothetical protein AB4290_10110 [Spirulina sp.]
MGVLTWPEEMLAVRQKIQQDLAARQETTIAEVMREMPLTELHAIASGSLGAIQSCICRTDEIV